MNFGIDDRRHQADAAHPIGHDFDRLFRRAVAELALVLGVEFLAQVGKRRDSLGRAGHGDLVALSGVAQVERAIDADVVVGEAVAMQVVARLRFQLREHGFDVARS